MAISKSQREILSHTLYRAASNYYCGDSADMQALVSQGLMISEGKKGTWAPDEYFTITAKGRQALKENDK